MKGLQAFKLSISKDREHPPRSVLDGTCGYPPSGVAQRVGLGLQHKATQRNPPATARFGDAYFPDSSSLVPIHPSKWRRPAPKGSPFTLVPSRFWLLRLLGYLPRKPVKQLRPGPPASPSRLGPIFIDGPEVPLPLCFSVHGAGGRLHDWMAQSLFVFFPLRVPRFKGVGACVEPGSAAHMLGEPGGLL